MNDRKSSWRPRSEIREHGWRYGRRLFGLSLFSRIVWMCVLVGLVAGLGAIVFDVCSQFVSHSLIGQFSGYVRAEAIGEYSLFPEGPHLFRPWRLLAVLFVGGLVSGWIVYTLAPEAEGHGTDAAIDAFHHKKGIIRGRVPFIKTLASITTLGTGGSGGREGPIAQIGAGFGSWLAQRMKLSSRERRILLAAGMGAGVGAIFRAPLAGAVFSAEILYSESDMEFEAIVPATTASIISYSIYSQSLPAEVRFLPLFGKSLDHLFIQPIELAHYAVLAIILTIVGGIYVKTFYGTQELFRRIPIIPHIKPAIGAVLAGCIAISLLYWRGGDQRVLGVMGTGYGALQRALTDASSMGIPLLLTLACVKILTTSLTISSGGSGGVFGPSMVIGGCIGGAVGLIFQHWFPTIVCAPEAYTVVGMAGFFAGVARAPLSTIIMVRSLTGDYGLLLPTMLVTTMTFSLSGRWTLYCKQVPTRLESPAHRGDFIVDLLKDKRVADVMDGNPHFLSISEQMTLKEIVNRLAKHQQRYFPVTDKSGRFVGMFTDSDVRSYIVDDGLWDLIVARDLMSESFLYVTPEDDLHDALRGLATANVEELPVVDENDHRKLIGMIERKSIMTLYNEKLIEFKNNSNDD